MKTARDYLSQVASDEMCNGFNSRLYNNSRSRNLAGLVPGLTWCERIAGWDSADTMIHSGQIFSMIATFKGDIVFKCFKEDEKFCCIGAGNSNCTHGDTWDEAVDEFCMMIDGRRH